MNFSPAFFSSTQTDRFIAPLVIFLHLLLISWAVFEFEHQTISAKSHPKTLLVQTLELPKKMPVEKISSPPSTKSLTETPPAVKKNPEIKPLENKTQEPKPEIAPPLPKADKSPASSLPPKPSSKTPQASPKKQSSQTTKAPSSQKKPTPPSTSKKIENPSLKQASPTLSHKQQELLAKAKESLSKVNKPDPITSKETNALQTPKNLAALNIDSIQMDSFGAVSSQESSYGEEIIKRLKIWLKLPEHGETKIKLTLKRNGGVEKLIVVASKSRKNKEYLEANLPHIQFPAFGENFKGAAEFTFSITLEG